MDEHMGAKRASSDIGSKGYSCCKRRVLEFDQFMKIPGCATGRHLFIGAPKSGGGEELVLCR